MINVIDYLNRTIFCKLAPSPIHGVGVFAIRDIPKGQELTNYYGHAVYEFEVESFDGLLPEIKELVEQHTIFRGDKKSFLSPNMTQILQVYMNHADDPNSDGKVALRDIKKGEEITENYNTIV